MARKWLAFTVISVVFLAGCEQYDDGRISRIFQRPGQQNVGSEEKYIDKRGCPFMCCGYHTDWWTALTDVPAYEQSISQRPIVVIPQGEMVKPVDGHVRIVPGEVFALERRGVHLKGKSFELLGPKNKKWDNYDTYVDGVHYLVDMYFVKDSKEECLKTPGCWAYVTKKPKLTWWAMVGRSDDGPPRWVRHPEWYFAEASPCPDDDITKKDD